MEEDTTKGDPPLPSRPTLGMAASVPAVAQVDRNLYVRPLLVRYPSGSCLALVLPVLTAALHGRDLHPDYGEAAGRDCPCRCFGSLLPAFRDDNGLATP